MRRAAATEILARLPGWTGRFGFLAIHAWRGLTAPDAAIPTSRITPASHRPYSCGAMSVGTALLGAMVDHMPALALAGAPLMLVRRPQPRGFNKSPRGLPPLTPSFLPCIPAPFHE